MSTNLNFNADSKSNLASYTTAGEVIFTEDNLYLVKNNGSKIKYSSIEVVTSLPENNISVDKIYILSSNYSLNYYGGSAWHTLTGGSSESQIIIGTIEPTDISKLFLDITDKTMPILKWYDSTTTTWVNISGTSVDTSTLLDKITYKGSAEGIVKKADTLTNMTSTVSQIDNTVANSISVSTTNRSTGKVIGWNNGENQYLDITVTGIVGSTGNLISAGANVSIPALSEAIFTHPPSTDDKIMINVQQQVIGSSVTDNHVDFSDSSKYVLQDSDKIIIRNNSVTLDVYTKLLMHMEGTNGSTVFTDSSPLNNTITSSNATVSTSQSKFGSGSALMNNGRLTITDGTSAFAFGTGDFTMDGWFYFTSLPSYSGIFDFRNNLSAMSCLVGNSFQYFIDGAFVLSHQTTISINQWYHLAIVRHNGITSLYINGIKSTNSYSDNKNYTSVPLIYVGGTYDNYNLNGYIDEFRISNIARWISNFTLPISQYNPYLISNTSFSLKTTSLSNYTLTTTSLISSISSTVNIPTNTSVKVLFSVDNGVNYLYKDGTGIHKYTGDLTVVWTSSNQWSEISTYFTNLSIATLTNDLSSLGIVPVTLDFIWQLSSSDLTLTPSVGKITLVYTETNHTELASFGGYGESTMFGVKRINSSTLGIKNNSSTTKIASVNVLLGTV